MYIGPTPADLDAIDRGDLRTVRSDQIRNISRYDETPVPATKLRLSDLYIDCQGEISRRDRGLYAYSAHYEIHQIDNAAEAMRIAKSLHTIEHGLERFSKAEGYTESFAQYVRRVATLIGATRFVYAREKRGSSYDTDTHRIMEFADGVNHVAYLERQWRENEQTA